MSLITSLLKPRGVSLNFRNTKKKSICLFLISKIINLCVRCILDFKRNKYENIMFLALERLGLTRKAIIHSTRVGML